MSRELLLTVSALVAVPVGVFAAAFPRRLLASKGVAPNTAAEIWVREVGVMIIATGLVAFLVRGEPNSPALRAVLIGNAVVQFGLLPIEVIALARGAITKVSGIVPNTALHVVLTACFGYYAITMG